MTESLETLGVKAIMKHTFRNFESSKKKEEVKEKMNAGTQQKEH